mmetsp:Transcript_25249/g.47729  ORF Transcript_25249/g.47729 Transcript_25249/m.47729 type:complete len:208 (-) Transcript_25249:450-1073(-)
MSTLATVNSRGGSCSACASCALTSERENGLTTPASASDIVAWVWPSITPLQSSPSTACRKLSRRCLPSSPSPSTSSYMFSPIALRRRSFFSSYSASSSGDMAAVTSASDWRGWLQSWLSGPPALPGGTAPASSTQWSTSRCMLSRVAIALLAKTITRTKAHFSSPRRATWAFRASTTLREYPIYCGCCSLLYTAYTPSGFCKLRASI